MAEFLGTALAADEIYRCGLRAGLPERDLDRIRASNKRQQVMGMVDLAERIYEDSDYRGVVALMVRIARDRYGADQKNSIGFQETVDALAEDGVYLELEAPGATIAEVASESAEDAGLNQAAEFALKALRRFRLIHQVRSRQRTPMRKPRAGQRWTALA